MFHLRGVSSSHICARRNYNYWNPLEARTKGEAEMTEIVERRVFVFLANVADGFSFSFQENSSINRRSEASLDAAHVFHIQNASREKSTLF